MKKITLLLTLFIFTFANYCAMAQSATLKEANESFEQFAYKNAIALYKQVLDKDKQNVEATEKLADCYRLTSSSKNAEFWYKKAIKHSPKKSILKFYYAKALMSNENYTEALKYFNEYKASEPANKLVYNFIDACEHIDDLKRDSSAYKITLVPNINSMEGDFSPVFYKDGLVFTSFRAPSKSKLNNKDDESQDYYANIYFVKQIGVHWSQGVLLAGKPNNNYHEGPATFNTAGNVMYFTRNVPKNKAKKTGEAHLQIYESHWVNNSWSDGVALPFCSEDYSVGHPTLSADGRKLYFSSNMPGSLGENDIWVSELQNGKWSKPENMGSSVNTAGNEMFPFIHPDGSLYFASDGWGGLGGLDIFVATPVDEDWTVTNMGCPINTARDDHGLVLNADKTLGYLASNRKRENDDIFEVKIEPVQAQKLVVQNTTSQNIHAQLVSTLTETTTTKVANEITAKGSPVVATNTLTSADKSQTIETLATEASPIQEELKYAFAPNEAMAIIGIAIDKNNNVPQKEAHVILTDLSDQSKKEVFTEADGNFMFSVRPGKQYRLALVGKDGVQDQKFVSTVNPNNTLIFYSILEGFNNPINKQETKQDISSAYNTTDSHLGLSKIEKGDIIKPILPISNTSNLVFKVQIGAFSRSVNTNTRYFSKVRNQVIEKEVSQGGLNRYLTGNTTSFNEAEALCRSLKNLGYRTAYVVAYLGGNRLDMDVQIVLSTYGTEQNSNVGQ